jgi:hypothetical protein
MIPHGIGREHVLVAMKRIDRNGIPPGRDGLTYQVVHGTGAYPPKLLVSFAHEEAFGHPLSPALFTGGPEVNGFLRRLGFPVVRKGEDPPGGTFARTQRRDPAGATRAPIPQLSKERLAALRAELLETAPLDTWLELRTDRQRPPNRPGVYAWFFDTAPPGVPTEGCLTRDGRTLLYVGISPDKPGSTGTLRSRLRFHYSGHAEGSTLRLTLGCLLEPTLGTILQRSGRRLVFGPAEQALSRWMASHTAVAWIELHPPNLLETHLLATTDLPLNIQGNLRHPFCERLRRCRAEARRRAKESPDLKQL